MTENPIPSGPNPAPAPTSSSTVVTPPLSRMGSESHGYELTMGDYLRILFKRRFIVVASFALALVGSILYTNSKIPLYATSSTVRIASTPRVFQPGASFFMPTTDFSTYEELVTGDDVLKRVVVRLGILPPEADSQDLIDKVDEIRDNLEAGQIGGTDLMGISIVYHDPELAAAIVNQAAEAFVEVELLQKSRETRKLRQFIETQLARFTEQLESTETKIQGFKKNGRASGVVTALAQQLEALQKERLLLLKRFTEKYPDVVKIDAQIENTQAQLEELPQDELELARLQRELELNDRSYRMMKDKHQSALLAEAEQVSDVTVLSYANVPTVPISPKKNLNKITGAIVGIILGVVFAFVLENFDTSIGTIEDVEQIVKLPVVGVIPHYNPHQEDTPWWRIDRSFMEMVTRRMPRDMPPDASFLIMNQDTSSTLAEAYRILRTFVEFLLGTIKDRGRVIIVTSTGPQEGKTVTSCNLAISLVQGGKKTILIDADLRRPSVHRLFGLERDSGLADVLLGTNTVVDARKTLGDILVGDASQWDSLLRAKLLDRLEVLTSGTHTTTPAELLTSDAMKDLVESLKSSYDYIIIDTPPVLPVTDTRSIGNLADSVFFVYRAGKTARRALTRAKDELKLAGIQVKGIILNQATPEITLTDKYYYQYYGEKPEPTPKTKKPHKPISKSEGESKSFFNFFKK